MREYDVLASFKILAQSEDMAREKLIKLLEQVFDDDEYEVIETEWSDTP